MRFYIPSVSVRDVDAPRRLLDGVGGLGCPRPNDSSPRLLDGVDLGNFGAVPVRTSSTGSDGTASKAEAKARAAAEELARLKAAAEKRASQKNRRRARRTRSAKAT